MDRMFPKRNGFNYPLADSQAIPRGEGVSHIKTVHLKVKPESWPWLDKAAIEVNQ